MKRTHWILALLVVWLAGCQAAPKSWFSTKREALPGQHVKKGTLTLDNNTNGTVRAKGVRGRSAWGGILEIDELELMPDVTPYFAGGNNALDRYNQGQLNFGQVVLPAYSTAAVNIIRELGTQGVAIAGQVVPWVQAVQLAKVNRPSVVQSLADLVSGGGATLEQIRKLFAPIDAGLADDVQKALGNPVSAAPPPAEPLTPVKTPPTGTPAAWEPGTRLRAKLAFAEEQRQDDTVLHRIR